MDEREIRSWKNVNIEIMGNIQELFNYIGKINR